MLAAMTDTSLSRRACALCRSAMISRRRRRRTLGPPATSCGGIRWTSLPCVESASACSSAWHLARHEYAAVWRSPHGATPRREGQQDRKSTRLNSSHLGTSYAVFCWKKKRRSTVANTTTSAHGNSYQILRPYD